jgi:hypothetical protein
MNSTHVGRNRPASSLLLSGCIAVAASLALGQLSSADSTTTPKGDVVITVTGVDPETMQGRTAEFKATPTSDGAFDLRNQTSPGDLWSLTDLRVSGNVDPFTSLNYAITNNAAVTLLFTVSVTLPISPQGPATVHGGSMAASLTDANNNGVATVATSGGLPFYSGQIDGATVLSMYPHAFSQSVAFAGQTVNVPALNPGLPGPTLPSGAALSTIGIVNRFTLTAGDILSGNSFFVVEPVPEPATSALVAMSLCFTTLIARRRKSRPDGPGLSAAIHA